MARLKLAQILFIFFVLYQYSNGLNSRQMDLTIAYFEKYQLKIGSLFGCGQISKNLKKMNDAFAKSSIRINFIKSARKFEEILSEKKNFTYYGYVMDLACPDSMRLLQNVPQFKPTTEDYEEDYGFREDRFKNIKIRLDSNIKIALSSRKNHTRFCILDVYNPGFEHGGKSEITKIGSWDSQSRKFDENDWNFYTNRSNMAGVTVRSGNVVLVANHSGTFHNYMIDSTYPQLDTMSKFHYPIFLLLMDVHGFEHELTVREKWFGNLQSGIDGGVAQLLYEDKIDITSTGGSQRPPRVDVIDYLQPSYHFRPCYIFRNPGTHNPLTNEFMKPFSLGTWWVITAISLVICILLKMAYNYESKSHRKGTRYTWATVIFITFSAIVQQGSSVIPAKLAGRSVFVILHLSGILLYNYYTSSILSSLLSRPSDAFNTLDELGRSKLEIGIEDLPYTITWFLIMNDSDVQYIYKNKVYPKGAAKMNIFSPEDGISKVQKGGFAYHTQLDTGYPIISRTFDQEAICDLAAIPMIPQVLAGTMIQKKSQYYELFHITLRKAKQAGLIQRISMIWEAKTPECFATTKLIPVGGDQTFIAFLFLIIGMILSLLVWGIEVVWFKVALDSKFN